MSKVKKNITYMLCVMFVAFVALACTMFGVNNKAKAAEITSDDFKVSKIGIRLIGDDVTQSGVRYTIKIKEELLTYTDAKVTVYILPQMFYLNGAHLKDGAARASAIDLVGEWTKENDGYATSAAYIYDFPANNYGVKLLAEASLTYTVNGTSVTNWTTITEAYSLTDIAKMAKDGNVEGVDDYIVENVKITYNNADGTKIGEESLAYGATLNYPKAAEIENKTQRGWVTSKSTPWDSSWTAQGNMTLTARYIFGNAMIDEKVISANGITSESVQEVVPDGFEKVWRTNDKYTVSTTTYLRGEYYSAANITSYKEIYFAVKTDYQFKTPNGYTAANGWFYFTFTQNDDDTWNSEVSYIKEGKKVIENGRDIKLAAATEKLAEGSLSALMDSAWYIPYVADTNKYVYFTELRGVKKPIEIKGDLVTESLFNGATKLEENLFESKGYASSYEFQETNDESRIGPYANTTYANIASVDVSGYEKITLECNVTADYILVDKWVTYLGVGDVSIEMTQGESNSWTIVFSGTGACGTKTITRSGTDLKELLKMAFYTGAGGKYAKMSVSEVRGVKKPIELKGDLVTGSLFIGATKLEENLFESKGYTSSYEFQETNDESRIGPYANTTYANIASVDVSGYEKITIECNVTADYILVDKWTTYLGVGNVSIEMTQGESNSWTIVFSGTGACGTKTITRTGTDLKDLLKMAFYTGAGGKYAKMSVSEVRGVEKNTLAKAGATEYKIIVPDKSENLNNYGAATRAAGELKTFFKEATGADFGNYVQDTGNLDKNIRYISIGFTNTLKNNIEGVDYDALGISGFSIKTVNGNVYISGQSMGLMNGVYEFLRTHFNYEYYTDGFYKIDDCTQKEVCLKIINEEIIPSFEYRLPAYGFEISSGGYATDNMVGYRMQYNNLSIKGIGGVQWHNFFAAIAPSVYMSAHSNWFSPDGKQLCLTRDKDGLATEIANKVKAVLESDASATFVMIGQEDNDNWCTCSACKNVISQYGGYSSSTYILFMNAVSDKLQPYLVENDRTDVKLGMFAYHKTQDAPVTVANGKTTLINGMKLNSNVCVVYAPIEANYYVSFNDELNSSVKKNIEGWGLVADNVLYWTYMENFSHYQLIFDNFGSLQENLKLLSENNGLWLYNLAQYNNGNSTGFSRFKAYLNSKLMWDVNADVAALTDDFFKNYFGVAADDMLRIYKEYRAVNKTKFESDNTIGRLSINGHVPSAKDYGFSNLNGWLEDIDHALAEAEKLKGVDDKEYERVKNAVILESLSIRYTLITYFGGNFDKTQLAAMKTAWKTDAAALNVTMCGEHKNVETLYSEWGI